MSVVFNRICYIVCIGKFHYLTSQTIPVYTFAMCELQCSGWYWQFQSISKIMHLICEELSTLVAKEAFEWTQRCSLLIFSSENLWQTSYIFENVLLCFWYTDVFCGLLHKLFFRNSSKKRNRVSYARSRVCLLHSSYHRRPEVRIVLIPRTLT